jgi:hypothetical protein
MQRALEAVLKESQVAFKRIAGPYGPRVVEVRRERQGLAVLLHRQVQAGWREHLTTAVPLQLILDVFGAEGWSATPPAARPAEATVAPHERSA